jgi:large subunit ribosomal protein L21
MEPYAVVETGGKQYRVSKDDVLRVEKIEAEPGAECALEPVLALSDGSTLSIGAPTLEGARVTAQVVEHVRGPKLINFKKKRRKGFSRKMGHRQDVTILRVAAIG